MVDLINNADKALAERLSIDLQLIRNQKATEQHWSNHTLSVPFDRYERMADLALEALRNRALKASS